LESTEEEEDVAHGSTSVKLEFVIQSTGDVHGEEKLNSQKL